MRRQATFLARQFFASQLFNDPTLWITLNFFNIIFKEDELTGDDVFLCVDERFLVAGSELDGGPDEVAGEPADEEQGYFGLVQDGLVSEGEVDEEEAVESDDEQVESAPDGEDVAGPHEDTAEGGVVVGAAVREHRRDGETQVVQQSQVVRDRQTAQARNDRYFHKKTIIFFNFGRISNCQNPGLKRLQSWKNLGKTF